MTHYELITETWKILENEINKRKHIPEYLNWEQLYSTFVTFCETFLNCERRYLSTNHLMNVISSECYLYITKDEANLVLQNLKNKKNNIISYKKEGE